MAKPTLFIDGEHGTTGLQIRERIAGRDDLEVISLAHTDRHDLGKRRDALCSADFAVLCLPDAAARDAVAMVDEASAETRIIDTSTAHRIADGWVYGFAEYQKGLADHIAAANRVSNPGCYSTGAIGLLAPLVASGIVPKDYPVTINAISGYTGGGKQLIAQMEDSTREDHIAQSDFLYALGLAHKHVPEITKRSGLANTPIFSPNVGRFAQGMLVNIPIHVSHTKAMTRAELHEVLVNHYNGQSTVKVSPLQDTDALPRLCAEDMAGADTLVLHVTGNDDHVNLVAHLDNLGKGASGAAVQNLDLMLA